MAAQCDYHDCSRCGGVFWGLGPECHSCREIPGSNSLDHSTFLRCPKCPYTWRVWDADDYDLFAEGEHKVECPECEHSFTIVTTVTYSFESPEMIEETDADVIPIVPPLIPIEEMPGVQRMVIGDRTPQFSLEELAARKLEPGEVESDRPRIADLPGDRPGGGGR